MASRRKPPENLIGFGRVAGSYGVRGWVKALADEPGLLAKQPAWWLDGVERAVESAKLHSGTVLAKLAGIETPEQAKKLKGRTIEVPRPDPGEGWFYQGDLVGLQVVNEQDVSLGVVKRVLYNGAHEVLELQGERTRLLPLVPAYVRKIDLDKKQIRVEWGADW